MITVEFFFPDFLLFYHGRSLLIPVKKAGIQEGNVIGFWATSLGAFIFVPAALTRTYEYSSEAATGV